jgi:hypothetical protein
MRLGGDLQGRLSISIIVQKNKNEHRKNSTNFYKPRMDEQYAASI